VLPQADVHGLLRVGVQALRGPVQSDLNQELKLELQLWHLSAAVGGFAVVRQRLPCPCVAVQSQLAERQLSVS